MTIDEQLTALRPLTPAAVASLAGYRSSDVFRPMRARGSVIPARRLDRIAAGLQTLAMVASVITEEKE